MFYDSMIALTHNQKIRKRKWFSLFTQFGTKIPATVASNRGRPFFVRNLKKIIPGAVTDKLVLVSVLGLMLLLTISVSYKTHSTDLKSASLINLPADLSEDQRLLGHSLGSGTSGHEEVVALPNNSLLKSVHYQNYAVKKGDSVSKIAQRFKISQSTLISLNKISNTRLLRAGINIRIPNQNGVLYKVRNNDNLSKIGDKYGIDWRKIVDVNDIQSATITPGQEIFIPGAALSSFELKKALGELFLMPTKGRLTSRFGYRKDPFTGVRSFHYGIDLANKIGTKVISSLDGVVAMVGYNRVYGNYIIIRHLGGYQTLYGHLKRALVRKGDKVYQGQSIGELGNTGRSTGAHLHFSIYKNQRPLDPLKYVYNR